LDKYWLELFNYAKRNHEILIANFFLKTKITSTLQLFFSYLQYANSVNKTYYEKNNGGGFVKSVKVGHASNPE